MAERPLRFGWQDLVVLIAFECIAVPICIAAGEAFVSEHYGRAFFGWLVGIPLAVTGFTAPWWKDWLGDDAKQRIMDQAYRWWPAAVFIAFAFVAGPEMYRRATVPSLKPLSSTQESPQKKDRSKQEISELMFESGALLDIVQKTVAAIERDWRESITAQNVELICINLNYNDLYKAISEVADRLRNAHKAISNVLEQNRIDRDELGRLLGYSPPGVGDNEMPGRAAYELSVYRNAISRLGEHRRDRKLVQRFS